MDKELNKKGKELLDKVIQNKVDTVSMLARIDAEKETNKTEE